MTLPRSDENEPMNENTTFEAHLRQTASQMAYPPTPDLRAGVRARLLEERAPRAVPGWRFAQVMLVALAVIAGLLAVPAVRAEIIRIMRLGGITVIVIPTPTPAFPVTATPTPTQSPGRTWTPAPSPTPQPAPIAHLSDLVGETTLREARLSMLFPIRLPSYPPELGDPDRVFVQNIMSGKVVVLVWVDPQEPSKARLVLHILGPGAEAMKEVELIQETKVNGGMAIWATGPQMLTYKVGSGQNIEFRVLVPGNVLIWSDDRVTYRLESGLPLEEAIKIAESVK